MKTGLRDTLMGVAGATAFFLVLALVWHFRDERGPAERAAVKERSAELAVRMKLGLARASEAEKSAVLAAEAEASKAFADDSRAALADVGRAADELGGLLAAGGTDAPRDRLAEFLTAFAELRRVDEEFLGLAVQHTNLRAAALSFGPAAQAMDELGAALGRLVTARGGDPGGASKVAAPALRAHVAALRIQALLAPHIAEESDVRMDAFEASMKELDAEVGKGLGELRALPALAGDADLAAAAAAWARLGELRTQILALSRANTNVRALDISLRRKRAALAVCNEALDALERSIRDTPLPRAPQLPR